MLEGAAYALVIAPHFWERPTSLALAAAGLALLGWSLYRLRVRRLVRRTEQLEAQVARRTAQVVAQKDELTRANEELTRLNDFKSEFLGIAAHDLKNPLSVIYGYAGLMISKSEGDPALLRVARRISASASQMLTIVSDLLDTTAMESGKLRFEREVTDLAELVAGVVESQRVTASERQISLELRAEGPALANVDREKMTRLVQNLVSNAVRYSRPETTVEVTLSPAGTAAEPALRLAVRDQGPGLAAPSTGLGLAIVKQFVEMHGGRIWVESTPGEGSTFLVEVPALTSAPR